MSDDGQPPAQSTQQSPDQVDQPRQPRSAAEFADQFDGYAKAARATATRAKTRSDGFGEQLASTRATVYERAADLVRRATLEDAAAEMMESAARLYVRTAPLLDFDNAGLQYISSRAWQYCAQQIDPSLPEVAPKWT